MTDTIERLPFDEGIEDSFWDDAIEMCEATKA